jgi:hypothetical protein
VFSLVIVKAGLRFLDIGDGYMLLQHMAMQLPDWELKKGNAELLILSLLEDRPRHGYELGS